MTREDFYTYTLTLRAEITWSGEIVFFVCLLQISLDSDAIKCINSKKYNN